MTDLAARRGLRRSTLAAWAALAVALLTTLPLLAHPATEPPGGLAGGLALAATPTPSALPPTKPPPADTQAGPALASNDPTPTATLPALPTATYQPGCVLYPGGTVPQDLPDNDPLGITASLSVPWPALPLTRVGVRIDELRHTYVGDLRLSLVAPDGTRLMLVDRVGNDSDDFYRTEFRDDAAAPIAAGAGPFTGAFRPDQSLAALSGRLSSGEWALNAADLASGDVGTLYAWALELCADKPLPPPPVTEMIPPAGGALGLQYQVEAGLLFTAAAEPLTATLATTGTHPLPAGAAPVGNFFVVSAVNGDGTHAPTAEPPVHITVYYAEADLPDPSERWLDLMAWDPALDTYVPLPTTHDPQANTLSADLAPLTEFGAVSHAHTLFLPTVRTGGDNG